MQIKCIRTGSFCTILLAPHERGFSGQCLYRSRRRCAHFQLDTERRGNGCTEATLPHDIISQMPHVWQQSIQYARYKIPVRWMLLVASNFVCISFCFHLNVTCIYDFNSYFNGLGKVVFGMNTIFIPLHRGWWRRKKRFYLHNISRLDLYLSRKLYVCWLDWCICTSIFIWAESHNRRKVSITIYVPVVVYVFTCRSFFLVYKDVFLCERLLLCFHPPDNKGLSS